MADYIPLLPSGARRAGAAQVMAARVGRDPSPLVTDPIKTQMLALGLGAIAGVFTKDQSKAVRIGAMATPILLTQALRRHELKSIQGDYDEQDRKRLRDLDTSEMFDGGWFGGSSRLGAVNAYETMRKRKYRGYGSLSEAGDAIQLAAGALHPALYAGSIPMISGIDNRSADRLLEKKSEFADQRNHPSIPLYLAAALLGSAGLGGAQTWAKAELNNTQPLGTDKWEPLVSRIAKGRPLMYSREGADNAFFTGRPSSHQEGKSMMRWLAGLQAVDKPDGYRPPFEDQAKLNRLMRYGAIVANPDAGAPVVAHEAGHARIEQTPGVLRFLQRHVYPHSQVIAPLAGAGSMAAGLASGSALKGALLGTLIGGVTGAGTVGPEIGASYHGIKGLGKGSLTGDGGKDLLSAISTYLAASVLPSTLSGAAGGWISGRRKKKVKNTSENDDIQEESEDDDIQEKAAAWDPRKMWKVLQHIKANKMSGNLADEYVKGIFGVHYKPLKNGFNKLPKDVRLAAQAPPPPTPAPPPPAAGPIGQQMFDFFKQGSAHPALPGLIGAKKHSDNKRYVDKNKLIKLEMRRDPEAFVIDSDDGKGIVGVTHVPTGFRIHMLKTQVSPDVLRFQRQTAA